MLEFGAYIEGEQSVYISEEKQEFLRLMEVHKDMKLLASLALAKCFTFEYMEDKRDLESHLFSEEEYKQQWLGPDIDGKHIVAAIQIEKKKKQQIISNSKDGNTRSTNNRRRRGNRKRGGNKSGRGGKTTVSAQNGNTTNEADTEQTGQKPGKVIAVISYGQGEGLDHIKSLAVSPAWKGKKIGTLMVCLAQVHLLHNFALEELRGAGRAKKIILFVEGGSDKEYVKKFYNTLGYVIADEENLGVACYGAESSCGHYMVNTDAFQPSYLTKVLQQLNTKKTT